MYFIKKHFSTPYNQKECHRKPQKSSEARISEKNLKCITILERMKKEK